MTDSKVSVTLEKRHQVFADEYMKTGNSSASAAAAGFSYKTRGQIGARLLKRPDVQAYLAQRSEALSKQIAESEETEPLQLRLQKELEKMAFANIAKMVSP
jgi:phage terminase small subunit